VKDGDEAVGCHSSLAVGCRGKTQRMNTCALAQLGRVAHLLLLLSRKHWRCRCWRSSGVVVDVVVKVDVDLFSQLHSCPPPSSLVAWAWRHLGCGLCTLTLVFVCTMYIGVSNGFGVVSIIVDVSGPSPCPYSPLALLTALDVILGMYYVQSHCCIGIVKGWLLCCQHFRSC
jgi:hypothetical protein